MKIILKIEAYLNAALFVLIMFPYSVGLEIVSLLKFLKCKGDIRKEADVQITCYLAGLKTGAKVANFLFGIKTEGYVNEVKAVLDGSKLTLEKFLEEGRENGSPAKKYIAWANSIAEMKLGMR